VAFAFFLLLNAVLFIRPAELVESLEPLRLYYVTILGCLATSYAGILSQFNMDRLKASPMTVCLLGLLAAVVLSHLQFFSIYDARTSGTEFAKHVLFYLLMMHNLNSPDRFQKYLNALVLFIFIAMGLALLQYHGMVNIAALEALDRREIDEQTGELIEFRQLMGTGMFNDPNDTCLILTLGIMICLYRIMKPKAGANRIFWLLPLAVFLLAFIETKSRGGFLAVAAAVNVVMLLRLGIRKTLPIWALAVPVVLVGLGGRMTDIDVEGGTGQHRIQVWREALELLRDGPLFGIGQGMMGEYLAYVAHNSYVHAYSELGLFGGTCFIAIIYLAITELLRLKRYPTAIEDPEIQRLRPYVIGVICGYCVGLLSLSRVYIVPTYLVFGLSGAYMNLVKAPPNDTGPLKQFDSSLLLRLIGIGIITLVALELGSRVMVRWEN
jgi:putative inorganic carbon (hco3(-)) transporter